MRRWWGGGKEEPGFFEGFAERAETQVVVVAWGEDATREYVCEGEGEVGGALEEEEPV
jgi:hypothetical protein